MTPATHLGFQRPKGCDHSFYRYALAPGSAYKIDDDTREYVEVPITKEQAARAIYTDCLRFLAGSTVAVFEVDGAHYAQPIHDSKPAKRAGRQPKEAPAERKSAEPHETAPEKAAPRKRRAKCLDLL